MVSKHQYQLQSWLLWFQKLAPGPWCQPVSPSCFLTPLLPTSYSCSIQSSILFSFVFSPHPVNPNVPWIFGCSCHQCKQGMLGCIPHDGYHDTFAEVFEDRGVCREHCVPCDPRCEQWHDDFRLPAVQSGGRRYNRQKGLKGNSTSGERSRNKLLLLPVKDK